MLKKSHGVSEGLCAYLQLRGHARTCSWLIFRRGSNLIGRTAEEMTVGPPEGCCCCCCWAPDDGEAAASAEASEGGDGNTAAPPTAASAMTAAAEAGGSSSGGICPPGATFWNSMLLQPGCTLTTIVSPSCATQCIREAAGEKKVTAGWSGQRSRDGPRRPKGDAHINTCVEAYINICVPGTPLTAKPSPGTPP